MLLRAARLLGWSVMLLALLYGFMTLGSALWLRRALAPDNLGTSLACWSKFDERMPNSRWGWMPQKRRDARVLYALRGTALAPRKSGQQLLLIPAELTYWTWWPTAERQRLFADVTQRMRQHPCPSCKP